MLLYFILSPRKRFVQVGRTLRFPSFRKCLWKSISTYVVPFLPKHSGICYSWSHPVKQSRTREKDMEFLGNRSQVAKAWVCKTSIRRFESDRFLQRHSTHHFFTCLVDRTGPPGSKRRMIGMTLLKIPVSFNLEYPRWQVPTPFRAYLSASPKPRSIFF